MKLIKKYLLAPVVCSASMLFFGGNIAMAMDGHQPPEAPLIVATQPSALWGRNSSIFPKEQGWICDIERKRHDLKRHPELYERLHKNVRNSFCSSNFRMYCLSIAIKIMKDDKLRDLIRSLPKTGLNRLLDHFQPQSGYFCLFYRCTDEYRSSCGEVRNFAKRIVNQGIKFLKEGGLSTKKFRNYDGISKLYILKSICAIASNNIISEDDKVLLLEEVGKIEYSDLVKDCDERIKRGILLTYSKIPVPNDKVRGYQIRALEAIFVNMLGETGFSVASAADKRELRGKFDAFDAIATKEGGIDALLTYAKIPGEHQKTSGLKALEAIFGNMLGETDFGVARAADEGKLRSKFDTIATKEGGIDALLAYAKIPANTDRQLRALDAIFGRILEQLDFSVASAADKEELRGKFNTIATKEGDIDALLTYAKIPVRDDGVRGDQIRALEAIFGNILGETNFSVASAADKEELREKFKTIARHKEGRDALLAYAKIPANTDRQLRALDAIFGDILRQPDFSVASAADKEELREKFKTIARHKEGRDALLAYARIPVEGSQESRIAALEAVHLRDPRNAAVKNLAGNIDKFVRAKSDYGEKKSSHLKRLEDVLKRSAQRPAQGMRAPTPGARGSAQERRESASGARRFERKGPTQGTRKDLGKK